MKNKQSPPRNQFAYYTIFVLLVVSGAIIVLILFWPFVGSGYISKTTLDPEYVPTAEYLLENPMSMPDTFHLELYVNGSSDYREICLGGFLIPDEPYYEAFQIYFDGVIAPPYSYFDWSGLEVDDHASYHDFVCIRTVDGKIETGLHLVKLYLNHEIYGGEYIHEWAIEIP